MSLTPSELDALPTQDKEWEGAQKPVPKGVYPCFLTMTTQEKFGCREREDVTREKPYVYVSKQFFLDDIQFRGAISDFHPMKALIVKYPEDDLMLCWDEEEWYGQNFFLSHSVESSTEILEFEFGFILQFLHEMAVPSEADLKRSKGR